MKRLVHRVDRYGVVRNGDVANPLDEPRTPRIRCGGVSEPFRSSARTVCERELAFQANGISRTDCGWIRCAPELQAVNVEPLQFHFNLPFRCDPLCRCHCLEPLVGQEQLVEST